MRRSTFLLTVCLALIVGSLPASSATRHVVMLFDERLEFPGLANLEAEFVRTLTFNSPDRIETYREPMDLSRFDSDAYRTLLKDYLRAKYASKNIDVAVAFFGPALDFLLNHGDTIFSGTPIVFCGVDKEELGDRSLPPHVRGVILKREFAPTLELALSLHPLTKQFVVVAGTSEFDNRLLNQVRQEFSVYWMSASGQKPSLDKTFVSSKRATSGFQPAEERCRPEKSCLLSSDWGLAGPRPGPR